MARWKKLADEVGIGEDAIKARLRKAEQRGLWTTSTSGKPGQPSSLAYQLVEEN